MSSTTTTVATPDPDEPDHTEGGRVVPFPTRTPAADTTEDVSVEVTEAVNPGAEIAPADEPIEAELVDPAEDAAIDAQLRSQAQIVVRQAAQVVRIGATHPHTRTVGRVAARTVVTIGQGHASWAKRATDALTHAHVREQIRAARAVGDREALAEWVDRLSQLKHARGERLRNLPATIKSVSIALVVAVTVLAGILVLLGLAFQLTPGGLDWESWWEILGDIAGVCGMLATIAVHVVMWGAVPAFLMLAWREGRRHGQAPRWLATASEADADILIDETTIAAALSALRIPQIRDYLKLGMPLQYLTPARRDGRGTHAVIRLPAGVPAEKIARRRADLATGLHRLAKEVWPTTGTEAGILDLWIADKGALAEGAGPYPLLADGLVDVFKGVPFGRTLRGEPIAAPLMERNTITGGMPGQGKSSAARVMLIGAALDPTVELRIWVPDANFDFEAFAPRCSRYVMGAEDEKIGEILADLRELHAEVQRRGQKLIDHEEPAVTREMASKVAGMHPLFCLLEEAHVAIQHKKYGGEISQLLVDIVRLGRKRGIHLIVSTQAPTKDSMPRDVTRNCSNGIAFAVGDHVANDALLGQGAYAGGHRATELIPGTDRGTAVVKGFSGQRSEIVQTYFLDIAKENDQVTPLIERAMAAIDARGRGLPGGRPVRAAIATEVHRDLLADLDAVLDTEPVRAADLPALLARHAPGWEPYRALSGKSLRELLDREYGIKVPTTGNVFPVDPVTIRDALAERATADLDSAEETETDE
ncbi:MAG TPA: cell division protein FtsK [Pseudonocardiaceae bacterium]|jgi:S-DNA-T family DNA segregation ATPase FtsK/SpoIIIE|nr:cell division protein FtsK [Pseudonocardiaceae bacterium]